MTSKSFIDTLRITVTTMQAAYPEKADALGRAHAAIVEGHVVDLGDGVGKVLSRNGHTWHICHGICDCSGAVHGKLCRHMQAWKLYQHVQRKHSESQMGIPLPICAPQDALTPRIPAQFLTELHGKPFVEYAGLLALAHAHGLLSLKARFISVTPDLAVAEAEAVFRDGRVFVEAADATPTNVGPQVGKHFARMALTRAKARCLRDYLNIAMCAKEEVE